MSLQNHTSLLFVHQTKSITSHFLSKVTSLGKNITKNSQRTKRAESVTNIIILYLGCNTQEREKVKQLHKMGNQKKKKKKEKSTR